MQVAKRSLSVYLSSRSIKEKLRRRVKGVGGFGHALTFYRVRRRYAQASITKSIWWFLGYILWNADDTNWNASMLQLSSADFPDWHACFKVRQMSFSKSFRNRVGTTVYTLAVRIRQFQPAASRSEARLLIW